MERPIKSYMFFPAIKLFSFGSISCMPKVYVATLLSLLSISFSFAQEDDPVIPPPDTLTVVNQDTTGVETEKIGLWKKFKDKTYPNPIRAAGFSLILPGSGQVYNKKIWKVPIVYGGLGTMGFLIVDNTKNYKQFSEAYLAKVDDDPNTIDEFPLASENTLLSIRNRFDKRRQQSYVFFSAIWILNAVDAFVDAHLFDFDVNEDISLSIRPNLVRHPKGKDAVLSLSFQHVDQKTQFKKFF